MDSPAHPLIPTVTSPPSPKMSVFFYSRITGEGGQGSPTEAAVPGCCLLGRRGGHTKIVTAKAVGLTIAISTTATSTTPCIVVTPGIGLPFCTSAYSHLSEFWFYSSAFAMFSVSCCLFLCPISFTE